MLTTKNIKTLIESHEKGRYNIYEINDDNISHFIVKDNDRKDKYEDEIPFSTLEQCRNYLRKKKVNVNAAKKINAIIPELIPTFVKEKKADLKTIDGVLEEVENALNNFKEGKITTSDIEKRLNIYQQAVSIHALKFAKEKFEYVKENKFSEDKIDRLKLIGGNGKH